MATSRSVKEIAMALIQEAVEQNVAPRVCHDVRLLASIFQLHPQLVTDLEESAVALTDRQDALRSACGDAIHTIVLNAFLLLQRESLLAHHAAFTAEVTAQAASRAHHHTASAVSAIALTPEEKKALSHVLEKKFSGTVDLTFHTDAKILGGLIVTVGDWQCDASTKRNIEQLHAQCIS